MSESNTNWVPDWFPSQNGLATAGTYREPFIPLSPVPESNGVHDYQHQNPQDGFRPRPILEGPRQDRAVRRKLQGKHLFMITLNGVLGSGLYWRGGYILEIGGGLSTILSFLLLGALAWAVMQCITEMMCIWPLPGALSVYVSEFVDEELGIAVGIAYWFTYSVAFSALISAAAEEEHYWYTKVPSTQATIDGVVLYALVPFCLVLINTFGVEIYGWIEVFTGTIKLLFLVIITVALIVFAPRGIIESGSNTQRSTTPSISINWDPSSSYDMEAANNAGVAFLMCVSFATFAYIGVEIVAASALEAKWPTAQRRETDASQRSDEPSIVGKTVKFTAIWVPALITVAYTLSGFLVSLGIARDDCRLPRLDWLPSPPSCDNQVPSQSAFVIIANSYSAGLANAFNVFLFFTVVTCANTNLYVASRALFGLASRLDVSSDDVWYLQLLGWFGTTNRRKVPVRAMVFSALAFCWVPYIQLASDVSNNYIASGNGNSTKGGLNVALEVLTQMGSVGVVIVWACECWAFIRFYYCIRRHRAELEAHQVPHVRRWDRNHPNDYPYRSHGQPLTAFIAFGGCLFILLVANQAYLWKAPALEPALSSYLIVVAFIFVWIILKLVRGARWELVDLSRPDVVRRIISRLHARTFPA